jgi:hypothetical protein
MAVAAQAVPTIEVRNPRYEPGHPEEVQHTTVVRAIRDDPLGRLHATGRLRPAKDQWGDDGREDTGLASCLAGRELQRLFEAAEVRGPRSVDLTQDPVDGGGRVPEIMTDKQMKAIKRLNELYPIMGLVGKWLLIAVLCRGMMPEEYARALGITDPREINSFGRELRRHLEVMAQELGYASRVREKDLSSPRQ